MRYVDSTLGLESGDRLSGWLSQELTTASALTLRTGFFSARAIGLLQDSLEGLLGRGASCWRSWAASCCSATSRYGCYWIFASDSQGVLGCSS